MLLAPGAFVLVGLGCFIYEVGWGHAQGFATLSIAVAATGAGYGADRLGKWLGK